MNMIKYETTWIPSLPDVTIPKWRIIPPSTFRVDKPGDDLRPLRTKLGYPISVAFNDSVWFYYPKWGAMSYPEFSKGFMIFYAQNFPL